MMRMPVNRLISVSIFIALVIAGRVTAQQPGRSGDGSRAITGRVINHNGQPLAGGKVFLQKLGGPRNFNEIFTNDAGEFRFDNLSPGVYTLLTEGATDGDQQRFSRPGDFVTFRVRKGGVITGTVADSTGASIIAARVKITRVRDEQGRRIYRATRFRSWQMERFTDDRGVYRFWGLAPGSYLVSVGGKPAQDSNPVPDAIDDGTPTYYPSAATPEAATEVTVYDAQEARGIDIRHNSESGHSIKVYTSGPAPSGSQQEGIIVMLTQAATGVSVDQKWARATDGTSSFVFEGLADGEYDLTALQLVIPNVDASVPDIIAGSHNRRVIVKGKDVTGVEMKLAPLGSIEGRVVVDTVRKTRCRAERVIRPEETVVILDSEGGAPPLTIFEFLATNVRGVPVVPDQRGNFAIRALAAAHYRVEAQLSSEDLYIGSINMPGPAQPKPVDAGRDGIAIKSGQRVTGLTISIQEGAASVRGRVARARVNSDLPPRLRAHLVPAERQQSDDVLRFAEAPVQSDGSFLLTNIAPGRYWLHARPADDLEGNWIRPLAWDRQSRVKLTGEAAAANNSIELRPCQRIGNHMLRYAPLASTDPKKM
jgi:hypothetical protein